MMAYAQTRTPSWKYIHEIKLRQLNAKSWRFKFSLIRGCFCSNKTYKTGTQKIENNNLQF